MIVVVSNTEYDVSTSAISSLSITLKGVFDASLHTVTISNISNYMFEECVKLCDEYERDSTCNIDRVYENTGVEGLIELINSSDYLNIPFLISEACNYLSRLLKSMSVNDIRSCFNEVDDFTSTKRDSINKLHSWSYSSY